MMKNKKGAIAIQAIVALVVVLAGFSIAVLEPVITGYVPYDSLLLEKK